MMQQQLHAPKLVPIILAILLLLVTTGTALALDMWPYLQSPTESSVWVTWKTSITSDTQVLYGTDQNALTSAVTGTTNPLSSTYYYHSAQLTNLQPNTLYYYRIQSDGQQSQVFRFKTQPPLNTKTGHYRFLVLGDHQLKGNTREESLIAKAKAKVEQIYGVPIEQAVNLVINDGDQVDSGTLDQYENVHFLKNMSISPYVPYMTIVGNHETYSDTNMALYKAHFFYDKLGYKGIASPGGSLYYSYQLANIVFLGLGSEYTGTTQQNWVQSIVTATKSDPNVDWMFSVIHRPYQAEQYVGDISSWLRSTIMPILAQTDKHVMNIGGHHHLYARGQTRDWPIYHIINGAASWDQYWGQSNEQDFDDVQKTIANWAWQIVDIDLDNREMTVDSYSVGHPLLGLVYDNKLIDHFHRKLGVAAPNQPTITNTITGPVTLPYTFTSTPYSTSTGEALNSVQYQFAATSNFATPQLDVIRDVENFYGDTGAPDYLPTDKNKGVDITLFQVGVNQLYNGTNYVRVRHRDANTMWSAWSTPVAFTVTGSVASATTISIPKTVFNVGESIAVTYQNAPSSSNKDWVGIYKKGQTPGSVSSTTWAYTPKGSGTVTLSKTLTKGTEYFVGFFLNDGYMEVTTAPHIPFYVGTKPVLALDKPTYNSGDTVAVTYSNAPALSKDWLGVYKRGDTPGPVASTKWTYVTANNASGTWNVSGLADGYYFLNYFANDGYTEIGDRVAFSVGQFLASVTLDTDKILPGQSFAVHFSNGPGTPKDYLGIFKKGAVPGVDELVTYLYVDGKTDGTVTFPGSIPAGDYYVALFINDSYTAVSRQFDFTILGDVSSQVSVKTGGFLYSRATKLFTGTMTITNTSQSQIVGPLIVALGSLTPGVSLVNATAALGSSPYVLVNGVLNPGAALTVPLQFNNPANARINFTPVIYIE
jgi:hypothetical protein